MCGICGFVGNTNNDVFNQKVLEVMNNTLFYRGPDSSGVWLDRNIGLAHRRLAILDLTSEGHQPMVSACQRYVISFNGEIYNFREIQKELINRGYKFRSNSDTEVMLAAISEWGLYTAVKQFVGMFAFALWDKKENELYLVRDRLGVKPLYYARVNNGFLFASELKALKKHPLFNDEINRNALSLYLRYNYIPAPYSIYKDGKKLLPGHILKLTADGDNITEKLIQYWSIKEQAEFGNNNLLNISDNEAIDSFETLMKETVKIRMIADVPLGAFLSGGIDSSTVVALMQAQSYRPIRTFSIGFYEKDYDEANYAKEVAKYLGTDHTELYIRPKEAMEVIPRLPVIYDEPFSDSSQIPTFLVSQLAKKHVTVSLSGDGGDELFGGYNRYFLGKEIIKKIGFIPQNFRKSISSLINFFNIDQLNLLGKTISPILGKYRESKHLGNKLNKLAEILNFQKPEDVYQVLISHWKEPSKVVLNSEEPLVALTDCQKWANLSDFTERMMFLDLISYLPDDILTKVDRASMAVSLESRVPLLDHRLVEFAFRVPLSMKIRDGQGKWLLRQVLYKYIPKDLIERPKMGFSVPIGDWLRSDLREWAEELLDETKLKNEGFFDYQPICKMWQEHLSGQRNWQYYLWDILMFQSWLQYQKVSKYG